MIVLKIFLILQFDSPNLILVAFRCLYILGAWKLLVKSGLEGWWSLIPDERNRFRADADDTASRPYCADRNLFQIISADVCVPE